MTMTQEEVRNVLQDMRVLVVEDDKKLAQRLVTLFKEATTVEPVVANYMDQAREEMRKETPDGKPGPFDLVVMDVMLPATESDFSAVLDLVRKISEAREVIRHLEALGKQATDDDRTQPADARQLRRQALRSIRNLIKGLGGVDLVEEWRNDGPDHAFSRRSW